jgi:hypothetical protein
MYHGQLNMMICSHTLIYQLNTGQDTLHQELMIRVIQEEDHHSCMHQLNFIQKKS